MNLPEFYLILFGALAVGQIGLAIFLWVSEKEFLAELARSLGLPAKQRNSWSLWQKTFKKTQNILGQAELEGVKIVADTKYYTRQLEGVYDDQFQKAALAAQQEFGKFLAGLEKDSSNIVSDAMVGFTKKLEEKFTEAEKTAKQELAAYKTQMTEKIKADMVEIMGEVTQVVLQKKLTFSDQADLISQALEQAKKEKFIT